MEKNKLFYSSGQVKRHMIFAGRLLLLLTVIAALIVSSVQNYLFFHTVVEFFCIVMGSSLFFISMNAHRISENRSFDFLGMAYGFIIIFNVLHTLAYVGIGTFSDDTYNMSVQFRIVSAYFESISFLVFSTLPHKKDNIQKISYGFSVLSVLFIFIIRILRVFPDCYISGVGQTPFKITSEIIVLFMFCLSLYRIIKNKNKFQYKVFTLLTRSVALMIITEILFTSYATPQSPVNAAGHIFKLFAYIFIYRVMVETSLKSPYVLLKRMNSELKSAIAQQKTAENELGIQRAYFQQLFESSPEGIVILDSKDKIMKINKGFEGIFQFSSEEIVGKYLNDVIVPSYLHSEATNYSSEVLDGNVVQHEAVRIRKDGSFVNVHILGYPVVIEDNLEGIFGIYRDITEQKKAEEKIFYLSFHDKLTGLFNRAFFEEELKRLDTDRQLPISLIMGDVNNLKMANDSFSHLEGDRLLVSIANILKECCRNEDIIARWGGDEFVLLLPQTGGDQAQRICQRIVAACRECREGHIQPSIALGMATKTNSEQNIEKILGEAEQMMYKNKLTDHSRNYRISIASPESPITDAMDNAVT
ncbi:putative diguanylate cyclase YdaM [Oxobacter pfennigii]|uniref:Putative diguanylate cyclase YdaM n=1 Tax=Oxobacter pfennigii TaxID=36849 RepID=A0A0N8NT26_9CLOT|nr:MASE3 domain-containing protein [Oxobacter pfennigii]KPU43656.1 putative diguanylate cyclase YdaM [Oxobacter pfennigii]